MRRITVPLAALTVATLLLPGCRKAPQQPPQNMTMELPATPAQPPASPPAMPEPAEKPKAEKPVALPATTAEPSEEEQMREDAEATGMTSRISNGNDASSTRPAGEGNSSER